MTRERTGQGIAAFVIIAIVGLVVVVVGSGPKDTGEATRDSVGTSQSQEQTRENSRSIPLCENEDGTHQAALDGDEPFMQVCIWDAEIQGNGKGNTVIHFGYGRYMYDVTNDTMHDWTVE